ncbi:hypothetical protein IW262DRAFT_783596 [Armillaria fumosa]|nr:hypothetical protein IW262DRAFT_783596 [Armillaria fumosa]
MWRAPASMEAARKGLLCSVVVVVVAVVVGDEEGPRDRSCFRTAIIEFLYNSSCTTSILHQILFRCSVVFMCCP